MFQLGGAYIAVVVVLTLLALMANAFASRQTDGVYRDRAVAIRSAEATGLMHEGIEVDRNSYDWDSSTHTVNVKLRLGACPAVNGHFNSPRHPQTVDEVGELMIEAPSLNPKASPADVPITAPNFIVVLAASALRQCVAGDWQRFQISVIGS